MEKKICSQCGKEFSPRHKGSKYCSKRCLWDSRKGHTPWNKGKGSGWTDKRGYKWNYVTENGRRVARKEHRIIMEKHLGRKLDPWELVHHKDEDTSNNDISNLEIKKWGEHTTHHAVGTKKNYESRKSMEAFALMREELKRERLIKSDLLEALEAMVDCVNLSVPEARHSVVVVGAEIAIKKALGD